MTLHIGLPKTGTSSLQNYLTTHRRTLAEQGICYPDTGRGKRIAHHEIANACRRLFPFRGDLREVRKDLAAELEPYDRAILSSEGFQNLRAYPGLVWFFGVKRSYRMTTVCYVREFLDMACSGYAQRVQNSSLSSGFERFCTLWYQRPLSLVVNFWRWFSDETQFGYFDRSRLLNQDIIEDFFHRIGVALPAPPHSVDANPSISGNLLGFKLLLNRHALHDRRLYRSFAEIALEDAAYRGRFRVPDAQAEHLRKRFASHNETIAKFVGEISCRSFEDGNPLPNHETWQRDLERFLSHPDLAHLKDKPEIYRVTAQQIADIVRL